MYLKDSKVMFGIFFGFPAVRFFFIFSFFLFPSLSISKEVMVNLTKKESLIAYNILKNEKGVLIKEGRRFIYMKTKGLLIIKGAYLSGAPSDVLYDTSNYHIKLNNRVIDLEFSYIKSKSDINKWIRLGSQVYPGFYINRDNMEYYIFKGYDMPENRNLINYGKISVTLEENEDDFIANNKQVFTKLKQVE